MTSDNYSSFLSPLALTIFPPNRRPFQIFPHFLPTPINGSSLNKTSYNLPVFPPAEVEIKVISLHQILGLVHLKELLEISGEPQVRELVEVVE